MRPPCNRPRPVSGEVFFRRYRRKHFQQGVSSSPKLGANRGHPFRTLESGSFRSAANGVFLTSRRYLGPVESFFCQYVDRFQAF